MDIIPTKNVPALIGYYLGVFSLIPCIGGLLSVPAVILGIVGLMKANSLGGVGRTHAIVALVLGGITTLLWCGGGIIGVMSGAIAQ